MGPLVGEERQHASVQLCGVVAHQELFRESDGVLPIPGEEPGIAVEFVPDERAGGNRAVHRVPGGFHDIQLFCVGCLNASLVYVCVSLFICGDWFGLRRGEECETVYTATIAQYRLAIGAIMSQQSLC